MDPTVEKYLFAFNGTVVSVALFVVSYRQTVGARRQRARNAALALERTCLRRLVQDSRPPTRDEVSLLRTGLVSEHQVRPGEIPDFDTLLATLYTRVADSDFLDSPRREALLALLVDTPANSSSGEKLEKRSGARGQPLFVGVLALAASTVGALIGAVPFLGSLGTLLVPEFFATVGASIAGILAFLLGKRVRERVEESHFLASNTEESLRDALIELMRKYRLAFDWNRGRGSYDFIVLRGGDKVIIEIRAWQPWHSRAVLQQLVSALSSAVKSEGAVEALVLVPDTVKLPLTQLPDQVRVLTLAQLSEEIPAWAATDSTRSGKPSQRPTAS